MKNPFEHNRENLEPGFYYDKVNKMICFYNVEEDEYYTETKIYNRKTEEEPDLPPGIFMIGRPNGRKQSKVENLTKLDINNISDKNSLAEDFKWLLNNHNVSSTFVQYLLEEERYLLLDLFKTFVEHQKTS